MGLAGERLVDESGKHHAVTAALARTHGVEEPDDGDRQAALAMPGEGEKLVDRLGTGVAPAGVAGRSEQKIAILAEGQAGGLAVDLGAGGEHNPPRLSGGQAQQQLGSGDIGFNRLDRRFDDALDADGGGEVIDELAVRNKGSEKLAVEDGIAVKGECGMGEEMLRCSRPSRWRDRPARRPGDAGGARSRPGGSR